jgi:hypothetical protein
VPPPQKALENQFPAITAIPLAARQFPKLPENAVKGQRPADNRKSDFVTNEFLKHGLFPPPIQTRNTSASRSNLSKALAHPLALTFPDTSFFIKVVRSLERKIDERLRSSTHRAAANR